MALKLKFKDEHGVLQINMSPTESPTEPKNPELTDPKFDTINNRFGQYDLFGGKYDLEEQSLFRSRYNSVEEELANTPYAFTTERSLRFNNLDVTIQARGADISPSKDIEDDRFFNRSIDDELFGPQIDTETPAFTVTQLIHAQDRYYDLSSRSSVVESPVPKTVVKERSLSGEATSDEAFEVLETRTAVKSVQVVPPTTLPVVPTAKRKKESSFAILTETPVASRPTSPRSLPVDIRLDRRSPFKGRGFREETSRHNTPKTSAANSRAGSRANSPPPRRRTSSLSKIDNMATTAALPLPVPVLSRPHSPRNFLKENIEEVRELSELNRERHEAEAERKRLEEEEALLIEMGLLDKNAKSDAIRSVVCSKTNSRVNSRANSRANSRCNSPTKINLRSRSNSPSAILRYDTLPANSKQFVNQDDGTSKPVTHRSRVRNVSKSQPQSNEGSPKHSKIPKRQNSVSPSRISRRDGSMSRRSDNNLKNQKFISNSTSSIHETIRIGSQVHDKRTSKSTQHLTISPAHIRGKPPISPGRGGPPPANKAINSKRLSPIVGTPSKSPIDDQKPGSAKTTIKPSTTARKPVKTAGNTPATSRLNSRQPSRAVSRDPSPEKRKTATKASTSKASTSSKPTYVQGRPVSRAPSTKTTPKPAATNKPETRKPPISRTSSIKSLIRTPSTKTLNEKPPLSKKNSRKDLTEKTKSNSKLNEVSAKKDADYDKKSIKETPNKPKGSTSEVKMSVDSGTDAEDHVIKQDNETQYDKLTNDKGELVLLTKKNIVSMTTAAITSQPLEIVTTVTNQLPAAFEKAREKGIFERLSSRDSLAPKDEDKEKETETSKEASKTETEKSTKEVVDEKEKHDEKKSAPKAEEKKATPKPKESSSTFVDDSIRLKLLQPPYNNPQVDRVKQKIDEILKVTPEVSTENILTSATKVRETKNTLKKVAEKTKTDIKETKDEVAKKLTEIKDQAVKQNEVMAAEMRSEATKIVDSIITPVEEPKEIKQIIKEEVKKEIEPIVMVVNEKKNGPAEVMEKMTETLVKGEPEVEVQSSNLSTPGDKMAPPKKMADGNDSDKSTQSNGGFPQSTSTTPKPPARTRKPSKDERAPPPEPPPPAPEPKQNLCQRLMGKCKTKCCPCCFKGEDDEQTEADAMAQKKGMGNLNCFKKKDGEEEEKRTRDMERAAGKAATIEYEDETKRKRTFRDICCACCGRHRRVSDVSGVLARDVALSPGVVGDSGCCGKRQAVERRDSILSDRPPPGCGTRLCTWMQGACRRHSEQSSSRRTSLFSKNKSLSPTLPPEDTRKKLDASLVEHTSVMKGSIPVLPLVLAVLCLICNVCVPGLGTILSGIFCLCFGIPRFGVYDGAKQRIGSLVINLLVGAGQLFTVLFCLVGWGWSIWWGVIMLKVARKYRKIKAEAAAEEAEAAPPVTANNHTRA